MDLSALSKQLEGMTSQMSAALTKRDDEIRSLGEAKAETLKQVSTLGEQLIQVKGELIAKQNEFLEELKNAGVRIDEVERKLGRRGAAEVERVQQVANTVVDHDSYKSFVANKERTSKPIPIKGIFPAESKATVALTSAGGDYIMPPYRAEPVALQQRMLRIRDLLPVRPLAVNDIQYLEQTAFAAQGVTKSVTSITRSGQTATATVTAHGYLSGDVVRHAGANQAEYNIDAQITVTGANTYTFTVAGSPASGSGTITAQKLNSTGSAGTVAEGALKPEALLEFALRTQHAAVIAAFLPASRQVLDDANMLMPFINDQLLYSVGYAEEQQILYGSGTGTNLPGIMTNSRVQTYSWSAGKSGDTKIDAIRRAITRAQIREYAPTGLVINPLDWEDVELAKDDQGRYLWLQVQSGVGYRIFQLPVVVTNAIVSGDFLTGAFASGAALWDREQANIRLSEEHSDYFQRNLVGILAEERLALTVFRPDSFVAGKFDSAPA